MSRARAAAAPGISLFPFLAVLLCTMGALLVLLVLFSRSAQEGREAAVVQAAADLALEAESLRWRLEQLEGMKARTLEELAKSRIQLATIEDNARDLADEFEQVEREIEALHAGGKPDVDHEKKIAQLQQRLAEARGELEAAEARAAERPPAYAVVPYQGSNGTHRRPLYIECAIDGVFLQPEGIRLRPSDFEGPPGPGNPLASGLRAAREHLAERRLATAEPDAQPYPLLLVRPSGVMAYYAAREAIASWGSDFGYQLVDEDWELAFPPRDAALAEAERLAIDEARRRLEWLANVRAARSRGPRQAVQYRASNSRGGIEVEGGPSVLGDPSRWDWSEQSASGDGERGGGVFGRGGAERAAATGGGSSPEGVVGGDPITGSGNGRGQPGLAGGGGQGQGGLSSGDQWGAGGPAGGGSGAGPGGDASGNGPWAAGNGSLAGPGGSDLAGGGGGSEGSRGDRGSGGSDGGIGSSGGSKSGGSSGGGGASGGAGEADGMSGGGGSGGSSAAGQSGGGGGSFGSSPSLAGGPPSVSAGGGSSAGCLASSRGDGWASMATRDRTVPLSRPVHIACRAEAFEILDESRRRVLATIPIPGETALAVDPLVAAIRDHIAGWGIAGERMYWNPRLVLSVMPGGTGRRDDLEALLAGSGLVTVRRTPRVASLPGTESREPTR